MLIFAIILIVIVAVMITMAKVSDLTKAIPPDAAPTVPTDMRQWPMRSPIQTARRCRYPLKRCRNERKRRFLHFPRGEM